MRGSFRRRPQLRPFARYRLRHSVHGCIGERVHRIFIGCVTDMHSPNYYQRQASVGQHDWHPSLIRTFETARFGLEPLGSSSRTPSPMHISQMPSYCRSFQLNPSLGLRSLASLCSQPPHLATQIFRARRWKWRPGTDICAHSQSTSLMQSVAPPK